MLAAHTELARLAGVPRPVIQLARQKLRQLEQNGPATTPEPVTQLELLAPEHPLLAQLRQLNPDELSARQALDYLYQLKQQLDI